MLLSDLTSSIEVLTDTPNLQEILWNFCRYPPDSKKRVTLAENPHFYYHHHLPIRSPNAYDPRFTTDPMCYYQDVDDIYVLTNKPGRVFLECGEKSRAFDNVWRTNGIFIFKGRRMAFSFLLSLLLTSFQTFVESSMVKVSSEHSFKESLANGVAYCLLGRRFGYLCRTGETQSSTFYIHKISKYALPFLPNRPIKRLALLP